MNKQKKYMAFASVLPIFGDGGRIVSAVRKLILVIFEYYRFFFLQVLEIDSLIINYEKNETSP